MRFLQEHLPSSSLSTRRIERKFFQNIDRGLNITQTGSPATILLVDDDTAILDAYRLWFEDLGYAVHTATSGEEALDLLRTQAVDAVVVDYVMPTMNGEESARRIRSLRFGIPIILFSGSLSLPKSAPEVFDAFVDKGLGSEALAKTLECLLHPDATLAQDPPAE